MNIWDIILDYLKVMLNSWPLIILIIFLTYRKQISNLLARIYKGRLYGVTFEATPIVQKNKINQDEIYNSPIDKAIEYFRKKPKEALNFYINLYKAFVFEKAFNVIFGTQIRLLEYLDAYTGLSGRQFRRHPDIKPEHTDILSNQFLQNIILNQ